MISHTPRPCHRRQTPTQILFQKHKIFTYLGREEHEPALRWNKLVVGTDYVLGVAVDVIVGFLWVFLIKLLVVLNGTLPTHPPRSCVQW